MTLELLGRVAAACRDVPRRVACGRVDAVSGAGVVLSGLASHVRIGDRVEILAPMQGG